MVVQINGLSPKEDIINGMMIVNVASMPFRAVDAGVEYACNRNDVTRKVCSYTGEQLDKMVQAIMPEPIKNSVTRTITKFRETVPRKMFEDYGIPEEETLYAFESLTLLVEGVSLSYLGGVAGKGLGKLIGESRRLIANARPGRLPPPALPLGAKFEPVVLRLPGKDGLFANLELEVMKVPGQPLRVWIDWLGGGQKGTGAVFNAFKELKNLARNHQANEMILQWYPVNGRLFELAKKSKRLEYLGLQLKPTYLADSQFPTFKMTLQAAKTAKVMETVRKIGLGVGEDVALPALKALPVIKAEPVPAINFEEAADDLLEIAYQATGVKETVEEAKRLKGVLVKLLSKPEIAPKELFKELCKVPENLYDEIVNSPEKAYEAITKLGADPTFASAASVVTAIFAIMSLTNEVLPFLDQVAHKIAKKPVKTPLIVSSALLKLTTDKVKGIICLAKGLIKNPFKASLDFAKGIAKTPKHFIKNIASLGGFGRKKAKRQKRKLKKLRKQHELALKQERIAQAKMEKIISEACVRCMQGAQLMWMIPHDLEGSTYATRLINDWKAQFARNANSTNFLSFLTMIEEGLDRGDLEKVHALSPTAHTLELIAPPIAAAALFELSLATARLGVATVRLGNAMEKDQAVSIAIGKATQELHQANEEFRNAIKERLKNRQKLK